MFPLYNPSIDYMQAFAAAKGKTKNPALLDAEVFLSTVSDLLDDYPDCNLGMFSTMQVAKLWGSFGFQNDDRLRSIMLAAEYEDLLPEEARALRKVVPGFKFEIDDVHKIDAQADETLDFLTDVVDALESGSLSTQQKRFLSAAGIQ